MALRIRNRLRDRSFFAWQLVVKQRAEARNLFRKQVQLIKVMLPKWRQFAIDSLELKRLIREKQEANAKLVAKSLNKILMRKKSQAFLSWADFVSAMCR